MSKTVLFIHDAWFTPAAWQRFRDRYEALGYTCLTPAWPFQDRSIEALRACARPALVKLSFGQIVDHHDGIIRRLPEPPIMIGHGFGGLIVQQLLDRGHGSAGIAIAPIAPQGLRPSLDAFRSALSRLLASRSWNQIAGLTFRHFATWIDPLSTPPEQDDAYDRYVIPAPVRIQVQAAFGHGVAVDFGKVERAPLLLIAGQQDRIAPPSMVKAAYARYAKSHAVTDYVDFPDRSHLLIATQGWEEIADHAIEWARDNALETYFETTLMAPNVADRR
jgi:pimeloyl-ACP methyl ester carboxylesterase